MTWRARGSPPTSTATSTARSRGAVQRQAGTVPGTGHLGWTRRTRRNRAAADVNLHLVLGSWRILGTVQRSLDIATEHVQARIQFGKPLADFQAVRFAVADASVAVRGLHELAKYTLSRTKSVPAPVSSADALVLRLKAADTARQVLRTAHQLLGALGFCDESDISVLDRHVQPLIRLPLSAEALSLRLLPGVRDGSLETLFSEPVSV